MQTYIEIILLGYIFSLIFTREFLLYAHGRVGQTQLPYWRRISQSEIRNSAAAEKNWNRKARAGKNSFPPTPFLFARPSDWIFKFGIRILLKKCSNINQKTPPFDKPFDSELRAELLRALALFIYELVYVYSFLQSENFLYWNYRRSQ